MLKEKKSKARLSMEVEVAVIKQNLKSLGRSFDAYKDHTSDKLDSIDSSIKEINKALTMHINDDNERYIRSKEDLADIMSEIRNYIDKRSSEVGDSCAKTWTENAVYGLFAFLGIALISTIGYLYTAKENDNSTQPQIEKIVDK